MRRPRLPRRQRERGATIIEAALVLPLLFLLALGIADFGIAYRDVNILERGVQSAARVVASAANTRYADYDGLRALDATLGSLRASEVQVISIYRATGTGEVPEACKTRSVAGLCNTYTPAQMATANPGAGFPSAGGSCAGGWDAAWCPLGRNDALPDPDRVGVWVRLAYEPVTGLIGEPTLTIERSGVFQVEPCIPGGGRRC